MVDQPTRPSNPKQLVDEFKKSGEFDRLRRQLLTHFSSSDGVRPLLSRVEEIVRDKLSQDERLEHKTREAVYSEIMQDMERYPIIERAVTDLPVLKDGALIASIEQYVRNIVRGESNESTKLWEAKPSRRREGDQEDEDHDASSDYTEDEEPDDDDVLVTDAKQKASRTSHNLEQKLGAAMPGSELVQNCQSHIQSLKVSQSTPRLSPSYGPPTNGANAASTSLHTPQRPIPQESADPSTSSPTQVRAGIDSDLHPPVRVVVRDSLMGEHLVNGVSAESVHDASEGGEAISKNTESWPE